MVPDPCTRRRVWWSCIQKGLNSVEFQWLIAVKLLFSPFFNCKHVHVTMTVTERLEQLSKQLSPGSQQIQMLHTPDMTSEEACKKWGERVVCMALCPPIPPPMHFYYWGSYQICGQVRPKLRWVLPVCDLSSSHPPTVILALVDILWVYYSGNRKTNNCGTPHPFSLHDRFSACLFLWHLFSGMLQWCCVSPEKAWKASLNKLNSRPGFQVLETSPTCRAMNQLHAAQLCCCW